MQFMMTVGERNFIEINDATKMQNLNFLTLVLDNTMCNLLENIC